jgi:hypothetical protein
VPRVRQAYRRRILAGSLNIAAAIFASKRRIATGIQSLENFLSIMDRVQRF